MTDSIFMKYALKEAFIAFKKGEVPVGTVVVFKNQIILKTHNLTEFFKDVTAHAELQAIATAAYYLGCKYLRECTLYVTIEPCVMCAGAMFWAKLMRLVFGAFNPKIGFIKNYFKLHPQTKITSGVMSKEALELLKKFFQEKRKKN